MTLRSQAWIDPILKQEILQANQSSNSIIVLLHDRNNYLSESSSSFRENLDSRIVSIVNQSMIESDQIKELESLWICSGFHTVTPAHRGSTSSDQNVAKPKNHIRFCSS